MPCLWPLSLALIAALAPVRVVSQAPVLRVRVVDEETKVPLPNAEVIDRVHGSRRFTNAAGEAEMPRQANELALRVRQLGFQFIDRTIGVEAESATFELRRVAYVLPAVQTTADETCDPPRSAEAALLSASVLEQLRAGAERYEQFRRTYPFRVRLERRSGNISLSGSVRPTRASYETEHSDRWGERYVPDAIVERTGVGFSVPILFLAALADSLFWERHCFSALGVEWLDSARVIRLAFAPKPEIHTPDWAGAALVDSATSALRRVEFRLTGLKPGDRPRRLEGITSFTSPTPFIVVPDTTTAIWWRRDMPAGTPWGNADVVQRIALLRITFLRNIPPDFRDRPR